VKRIIAFAVVVLAACSGIVLLLAKNFAERQAAGQPFCIQVTTGSGYREISSLLQLAGLWMFRSQDGPFHHAVLVIGELDHPRLLHWSYRYLSFREGAYGPPPLYCRPRRDYFATMEQSAEREEESLFIAWQGQEFSIPRAYHARPYWPPPQITATAMAPTFAPMEGRLTHQGLSTAVSLQFDAPDAIERWRKRPDDFYRIEDQGSAFGLIKERVWNKKSAAPGVQYYSLRPDGSVQTLISCVSELPQYQCRHAFESDGKLYEFQHLPKDIAEWRQMQQRLWGLFASRAL
jgi:hypothetical protein